MQKSSHAIFVCPFGLVDESVRPSLIMALKRASPGNSPGPISDPLKPLIWQKDPQPEQNPHQSGR